MGNIVYVVLYLTSAFYVDGLVNSFVDPIIHVFYFYYFILDTQCMIVYNCRLVCISSTYL